MSLELTARIPNCPPTSIRGLYDRSSRVKESKEVILVRAVGGIGESACPIRQVISRNESRLTRLPPRYTQVLDHDTWPSS